MTNPDSNPAQEQTEAPASSEQTATQTEEVTFSESQQKALDEIISKRLGEVKAKHDAEVRSLKDQHKKELARATMAEEERLKAEREDELNSLRARAESAEKGLRLADTRSMVVQAGLPPELAETVMGADEESTRRTIDVIRKAIDERASALYAERVAKGTPQAPTKADGDGWLDELRGVMSLPPKSGKKE